MRLSALLLPPLLAGCAGAATISTPPREVPVGPGPGRSSSVHILGVPPGQLPRVGQCRVWVRGTPPGRQARARGCAGIVATAPAGAMILYRVSRERVRVRYLHERQVGVIAVVRVFASDGVFVAEEPPTREDRDEAGEGDRGRGRGRRP